MRRLALILAAIAALPGHAAAPDPGPDTLAAVGRMGRLGPGVPGCTAALVDVDKIVTAAHCVGPKGLDGTVRTPFATQIGSDDPAEVTVTLRFQRLPEVAGEPAYMRDVAVLWIRKAPGNAAPLPVAPPPQVGDRVTVPAFRNGDLRLKMRLTTCTVTYREGRAIGLDCPAVSGNSGAPILVARDGVWHIAGVLIARIGDQTSLGVVYDPWEFD